MKKPRDLFFLPIRLLPLPLFSLALLAGCGAPSAPAAPPGAAAEATAIIQRAQAEAAAIEATTIIQRAQATAAAMATVVPTSASPPAAPTPAASATQALPAAPTVPLAALATQEPVSETIEVTGAGYAAEGAYIIVRFKAPPQVARRWQQGAVSVTDEATGRLYNSIPVAPLIGPLIGHPAKAGQSGYVMLINTPPGLPSGSLVTVVLGDFKQEHVRVQ